MKVEVVYCATPSEQCVREVELAAGATLIDAVRASGILERYPSIDIAQADFGVYGERATADRVLEDGDRVEIYRKLTVDPKEVRRQRALRRRAERGR